jgi:hypothetical protein
LCRIQSVKPEEFRAASERDKEWIEEYHVPVMVEMVFWSASRT